MPLIIVPIPFLDLPLPPLYLKTGISFRRGRRVDRQQAPATSLTYK